MFDKKQTSDKKIFKKTDRVYNKLELFMTA